MVEVDDVIELTKDRIGTVRYKGPLYGKNGIFYGIELSKGTGKNCGLFGGKRYFVCHKTKGIFVNKKQILYKLALKTPTSTPTKTEDQKKKKKKSKPSLKIAPTRKTSQDLGKFKIPRKTGPAQAKKEAIKSDWKPPSFMQDILEDNEVSDGNAFLNERHSHRGKVQAKTKYAKAPYLPHANAKSKNQIYKSKDWTEFMQGIDCETMDNFEAAERLHIVWEVPQLKAEEYSLETGSLLKLEREQAIQKQMDEEEGRMTKLETKRKELQDIEREIQRTQAKKARREKRKQRRRRKKEQKRLRKFEKEVLDLKQKLEHETAATQHDLDNEIQKLRDLRSKMEHEHAKLRKQRQDEENAIKYTKQKALAKLKQLADTERRRLEKAHKTLVVERQRQLLVKTVVDSSDEDRKREEDTSLCKKRKGGKQKKYKIFFSVNIETNSDEFGDVVERKMCLLRTLLADLFETASEKDVFEIKTRKKGNGFKIDFGIVIATSLHPADYIDTFDDLTMSGSFQETMKTGLELEQHLQVHMWEARYEKIKHVINY